MTRPEDTAPGRADAAARAAWLAFGTTAVAMVATPLLRKGGRGRMALADVVVGGLFGTAAALAARRWGSRRAATTAGAVVAVTLVAEQVGSRTGVPFGRYAYTAALRPQVASVPVAVPLAWFGMALPAREVATALGARGPVRLVVGSGLLTAWDLFLDPQMVGEGYWRWARRGAYRGIPVVNYLGWFATGVGVMALLDRLLPPSVHEHHGDHGRFGTDLADPAAVGVYALVAVMSMLGFAVFFGDPLVALVGGAAMVPPALVALQRVAQARRG